MSNSTLFDVQRYPRGQITPHGAFHFMQGLHPRVKLKAYDGSVEIELLGGPSVPDPIGAPECVRVNGPIKGLIGPWKFLDQQGANEDGTTYIDSVTEPAIVEIPVKIVARDAAMLRQVVNHLFGSIDKAKKSELSWFTPEAGFWWADVRWADKPPGGLRLGGQRRSLETTLLLRSDLGAWKSFDDVGEFRFAYDSLVDSFETDYEDSIGPDWSVFQFSPGRGYLYARNGAARFRDDPNKFLFTEGSRYLAVHRTFETETNNQVVEVVFDTMLEFGAKNYIAGRVGRRSDGSWNGYGVLVEIAGATVRLVAFNNFHETEIRRRVLPTAPPLFGEKWRLECGGLDAKGVFDERMFRVKRGLGAGVTVLAAKDDKEVSALGDAFKGAGFGGYAAGRLISQGTPSAVRSIRVGDATVVTQSGFIKRINIGDIDRFDRYTLYGPGTFQIAAAPGSTDMVEFGPLLPNQIVQLRTDGRKRLVVDLTSVPPTADELVEYREALKDLESMAPIGNIGPTLESNASVFGVVPPQGNMHRLLSGRFTRPIPAKSPGRPPETVQVAVSIADGNSDSRIIASGTNLRRYPN
ncbi:hypothetical protein [Mycobacterium sp. PSTR-4-N]|uniref:DUF7257 domain-containing protein n=1 Tax=Mycobacterium sp. PSTR-4-N TaxID=2917745 RepID=UPI001F14A987|nr:hypothetical protein [Mycobacterium sp. PSTR-4-N]MCG7596364.1 hypothetical protein [Mycobacterium sp. PSTR-4-N]